MMSSLSLSLDPHVLIYLETVRRDCGLDVDGLERITVKGMEKMRRTISGSVGEWIPLTQEKGHINKDQSCKGCGVRLVFGGGFYVP